MYNNSRATLEIPELLASLLKAYVETANLKSIEDSSFDSIKYFVDFFLLLLLLTFKSDENNVAWDLLQKHFIVLQCEDSKFKEKNIDEVIEYI